MFKKPHSPETALFYLLVFLTVGYNLAPFLWQILTSLKTDCDISAIPTVYWPSKITLEHYVQLFLRKPFGLYLFNSFRVSFLSTAFCLILASMAGYGFARSALPFKKILMAAIVAVSVFPTIVFFFPLYELIRKLGLLNQAGALVFPNVAMNLPFAIVVLTGFFRKLPVALEEAAALDGLNRPQTLFYILLPVSLPALITTGIIVFINSWNEFIFAISFINREALKTVPAGIASLGASTYYELPWGQLTAAAVASTLPLIILVLFSQRYIMAGLTEGIGKD